MIFCGVLQTELTEETSPKLAFYISFIAFGLYHLPQNDWENILTGTLRGLYILDIDINQMDMILEKL